MIVPNWFGAGRSGIGSVVSGRMLSMTCPQGRPRWQERLALVAGWMREVQNPALSCPAKAGHPVRRGALGSSLAASGILDHPLQCAMRTRRVKTAALEKAPYQDRRAPF